MDEDEKSQNISKEEEEEKSQSILNEEEEEVDANDEDDYEGYFLEPVGETVDLAVKVAEANKKLFEEVDNDAEDELRPRKVQFSENLINFEPDEPYDYSDSTVENGCIPEVEESDGEPQEREREDDEIVNNNEESKETECEEPNTIDLSGDHESENNVEDIEEEIDEVLGIEEKGDQLFHINDVADNESEPGKLLLILLPRGENSSCESVIGEEEILEDECLKVADLNPVGDVEKSTKTKFVRPKSASSLKHRKTFENSKISPNLNYSSDSDKKSSSIKGKKKSEGGGKKSRVTTADGIVKKAKKFNIDDSENVKWKFETELLRCETRTKNSSKPGGKSSNDLRPNTAPIRRTCCVIKSYLPQYNGLRSEYGLSAEQLEERKQRSLQIKCERKQEKKKRKEEERKKRHQNEEIFQMWLLSKSKKDNSTRSIKGTDTLARSDIYIRNHASYASNPNVPYSVTCKRTKNLTCKVKKNLSINRGQKAIVLEKMLDKMSLHFVKSFNIYMGARQ
ncbi:hypothetical protein RUM44_004532 [Polyplax serrata]|uniref:Coiled-coil domain-containing protein 181 n=1 Tax=Polyplax serrata TaxID=468196 RepID=A0ABR1B344_POLSC